jgi:hypothetical protein
MILLCLLVLFAFSETCLAQGLVTEMLKKIEQMQEIGCDLTTKITLTEQRVRQGTRQLEYIYYRRDSDDAFLLVGLSPEREKGNGYLRMEDNIWMYRRNTRTFQHLSREDRIGDTEISAESFESRKLTELYGPVIDDDGNEIYTEEMLGEIPVYKFEVKAIVRDVSYPKHIYWVRRDNYLIIKQDSFSLSDTLMQTSYTLKYTKIEDRYLPIKGMVVDQFERGNKTIYEGSGISLKPIDDAVFTKAYLENLSK